MASALVVLASAIVLSACTLSSKEFDKDTIHLEEKVPGESFSLHCSTEEQESWPSLYKASKKNNTQVMHVFENGDKRDETYHKRYENRMNCTGPLKNLSIIITNLTEEDTGVYYCLYSKEVDGDVKKTLAQVVALFMKWPAVLCPAGHLPPTTTTTTTSPYSTTNFILALFSIFTAVVVFLMFSIMLVFYVIPKIKTLRAPQAAQNRGNDSVYEVMSATLKRT